MNRSFASEIERAVLDHLLYATRMSLGIAWKLAVSALAVAIVLGMVAGPAARSERASLERPQPVRVEKNNNTFRILTKLPEGKDTLLIELIDPVGKKHLNLIYGKNGVVGSFGQHADVMQLGFVRRPGGGEMLNVLMPQVKYSIELHSSGESGVIVFAQQDNARRIGEIRVSPNGDLQPSSDDIHVAK